MTTMGSVLAALTPTFVQDFRFVQDETWFSSIWTPIVTVPLYLIILELIKRHVASRGKPYQLQTVVIVHNSMLSIVSAVTFIAMASELTTLIGNHGFVDVFCDPQGQHTHGRIYFLYYLNYILKFVELFDTMLLALRGRETPFLHVYHHSATLVLCWSQLLSESCLQWVVIIINLGVHIIMYLYYALHAMGINVWWKRYITVIQITQFVIALIACLSGFSLRVMHDTVGTVNLPGFEQPFKVLQCHGGYAGAFFGIFILFSYLILFVRFYDNTYKQAGKAHKGDKRVKAH